MPHTQWETTQRKTKLRAFLAENGVTFSDKMFARIDVIDLSDIARAIQYYADAEDMANES